MPAIQNGNFGRVVYLTLIRDISNEALEAGNFIDKLSAEDSITICYDPWRENQEGQFTTRIDFYVKHLGQSSGTNGVYAIANIDVWNIGPALQNFLDAYNAYKSEGHFAGIDTKKYAVVLQVGYRNNTKRTALFAGHISSFVLERQQNEQSVDNVWHFFCQYPNVQQAGVAGENKATSGTDYSLPDYWNPKQSFVSWEQFLKQAIMARRRTAYDLKPAQNAINSSSFEVSKLLSTKSGEESLMCPVPKQKTVNYQNFSQNFSIQYRVTKFSPELKTVKEYWQQQVAVTSWNLDVSNLSKAVANIARAANCHSRIELDEQTGKQTIYIYPANWISEIKKKASPDYVIEDYQNLRTPPQVAANLLHLNMMLEPSMRPGKTIKLTISEGFKDLYKHTSFDVNYAASNTATLFAGDNFLGLAQAAQQSKTKEAMASTGNIFNSLFVAMIVEFRGSTHSAEWSTQVDCVL